MAIAIAPRYRKILLLIAVVLTTVVVTVFAQNRLEKEKNVIVNSEGAVVISDRDNLPFAISFTLPQNCSELDSEMQRTVATGANSATAPDELIQKMTVLIAFGEDLCSYRDWGKISADSLSQWFGAP